MGRYTRRLRGLTRWSAAQMAGACWLMLLVGCAAVDGNVTKLVPLGPTEGGRLYRFEAFADPVYPVDSARAEKIRMQWLERRLSGLPGGLRPYTILTREAVNRHTILETWEIYYTVRVEP
jgi:hypothetical protein